MSKWKQTSTTLFLVPVLGLDADELTKNHGFLNGYMDDKDHDTDCLYPVYLLFRPSDLILFEEFVQAEYKRTDCLICDYDYDGGFVVLFYHFPKKFEKDYKRFLKGQYTKLSKTFIALLPAYEKKADGTLSSDISLQHNIALRLPEFVEYLEEKYKTDIPGECWSIPSTVTEKLNIELISNTLNISQWRQKLLTK